MSLEAFTPLQLHTPEPEPPFTDENPPAERDPKPSAPPIEDERGPQYPVREPGSGNPPERVRGLQA